jgi:four helix bundle protein
MYYPDLDVYKKSKKLIVNIYNVKFPADEKYGLQSQIRRAAVSIAANIAEGAGRHSYSDYSNFIRIAKGSAFEVEALLDVATELKLVDNSSALLKDIADIKAMLTAMHKKLKDDDTRNDEL